MIIDFSKWMNRVLEVNVEERWARVEPGYLLVHLDRAPNRLVHAVAVNLFFTGTVD